MPTFHELSELNGSVLCNGREYAFCSKAMRSDRVFDGSVHGAELGTSYYDEWFCIALDWCGKLYTVSWLFVQIKGQEVPIVDLPWFDGEHIRVIFL